MLATQTLHQCVPWMNSKNPNAGNYFMLLRGVAMVTMATDFLNIRKFRCHGYHRNAPEQHKIISRIRIFRIHPRNTLVKSLSG